MRRTAIGAVSLRTAGCAGTAAGEDTVIVDPFRRWLPVRHGV